MCISFERRWIHRAALTNVFERIVIVVQPKILGDLRQRFTNETGASMLAETGKDLTNHKVGEIEQLLMPDLW
ncbi:MAG: host attachment protein [Beijerinckiaceae bacterium]|nr:host attachment protein [Beijerinckiaceae bacterium]MCI0735001.1 host attachment protein [Beijerinckiaceae bacterium]